MHVDERLTRLATLQHGVASRAQLLDAGLGRGAVRHRMASGALTPLFHGTYALGRTTATAHGWAQAALLSVGADAVLSHRTAAFLWGLAGPPDAVHLNVPRRLQPRAGLVPHSGPPLARGDTRRRDGLSVTSPLRTLADLRDDGDADFDRLASEAQVLRLVTADELERIAPAGAAPSRSALERAMNRIVTCARLPRPLPGRHVAGYECDFLWPRERVIVETDGWDTHGHRTRFETDRARDATHAALGYVVLRFTWRQLVDEPMLVAARLAQVLALRGDGVPG
jgi:very-short-patch-repair endonuclease